MFGFMKKLTDRDKEEREKKKKEKDQKKLNNGLTADELIRLEEAKQSLQLKSVAASIKLSSVDNTSNNTSNTQTATIIKTNSSIRSAKGPPPTIQPKPIKIGLLKEKSGLNSSLLSDNLVSGANNLAGKGAILTNKNDVRNIITSFDKDKESSQKKLVSSSLKRAKPIVHDDKNVKIKEMDLDSASAAHKISVVRSESPADRLHDRLESRLPPLVQPSLSEPRKIVLNRLQSGDFGFSLRKGMTVERKQVLGGSDTWKHVIFAEVGPKNIDRGFLPGDRIIEVNGCNVETCNREAVIDILKRSGGHVEILVQTLPEFTEVNLRLLSSNSSRNSEKNKMIEAKTEDQLASDQASLSSDRVWLIHKSGFTSVKLLQSLGDAQARVEVDPGDVIIVPEENLERVNPSQFDRIEDLTLLRFVNESSLLHTLRQRYANNLIHTYAGFSLVSINSGHPLSLYSDKVVQLFRATRSKESPPHVYSVAQSAFKAMMTSRQDQSIVLMGRCGSGKTFQTQNIINYFVAAYGSVYSVLTSEKVAAISLLLESFASCRSASGFNSTKFTQVFSLDFDQNGQIVSASVQIMMLEKTRTLKKMEDGSTFNIFNYFLNGMDANLRKELFLESLDTEHPYFNFLSSIEDNSKASQNWNKVLGGFKQLKVSDDEVKAFCLLLAAIYHLGSAGVIKGPNSRYQFKNSTSAQHAARLLGTTVDELTKIIFYGTTSQNSNNTLSPALRLPSSRDNLLASYSGEDLLECFMTGLYAEVFNALVALINRSLASNFRTTASILVVDAPGFRGSTCGKARLEDLFHNYVQERLQNFFYETVFNSARDLYSQEGVKVDFEFPEPHSSVLVQLIDNPPQNLTRSPESGGKLSCNRGMLWVLDEQSILSSTSDASFLEELFIECSHFQVNEPIITPGSSQMSFVLNHLNGSSPVEYEVAGWLKSSRDGAVSRIIGPFLIDSKRPEISDMFSQTCRTLGGSVMSGSIVGVADAPSSLRRASSMKRTFTSGAAAVKKRSLSLQIKFQSDALIDMLKRTKASFIHCFLPHESSSTHPDVLDLPLLRTQLRSSLVLSSVRLFKQGFPEHMSFSEFHHKFRIIGSPSSPEGNKNTVEEMMRNIEIDQSLYRLGSSKVFFHAGVLDQLEMLREENVSNWLIKLQALCRMHLARKTLQKLKLQHMAVSCIQKNVRKLMAVRTWSWWKLYVRIKPLLDVHRTEEELKDMQFEVEQLRQKLEKTEKEKFDYKQALDKFEVKVTDLVLELQDEHNTAVQASELLENETAQRLTIEKELKDLQVKYNSLQADFRGVEIELMNVKMMSSAVESDTEDELGDSVYKERYERLKKETEYAKKKMEMNFEEQKDELESSKRILEKKLSEMSLEVESREKSWAESKKKLQRQTQEMADMKLHLEEQVARNSELEKKQRKFDVELAKVNEILKNEKLLREKLHKEKDEVISQKYSLEQEYKNLKDDFEVQAHKLQKVEMEILELVSTGKDDKEAVKNRQAKNEMESKLRDLEEELDEQAGTIQQLEQAKLRLEMSQEKIRQQHLKELEEKENDFEELKRNFQKKFRTLEVQLEEEYEEKQRYLKEKRELERKVQSAAEERPARDKDTEMLLKRDLKRTKALLQDAQLMLQKYKEGAGNRQTVKQLREQLEDAEFATAAALKAKKSMELEVNDLQQQLDSMIKIKNEAEEKFVSINKEKYELLTRIEENDEEMTELMKKYKAAVQQHSLDLIKFEEQSHQIESLEQERENLKEEMVRLQSRTDYFEASTVDKGTISRLEAKIRDLEAKLDFEQMNRKRSEVQLGRLKDQLDAESDMKQSLRSEETRTQDQLRQLQRKLKETEDELLELRLKESEAATKKHDLERKLEDIQIEHEQTQSDLHLAFKRIADLQAVIEDDIGTNNDSDEFDSDLNAAASDDDDDDDMAGTK